VVLRAVIGDVDGGVRLPGGFSSNGLFGFNTDAIAIVPLGEPRRIRP
jgi:hypothetical protein